MSDDFSRHQRGMAHGFMVAGFHAVDHAVQALGSALNAIETAKRGGIPPNQPGMRMSDVEANLRAILARVVAINAPASENREAA